MPSDIHPPLEPTFARLLRIIQGGECVLFLGAGVSLDSGAPSGSALADEIRSHFFGSLPHAYPLDEVCELVDSNEGRRALNEWLVRRFAGLSPSGALLSIPKFRWRSIYTTNFDTLLEDAYKQVPDRLQTVHPIYSDRDPLSLVRPDEVPLYKLHGCLSRANSDEGKLVLTVEDYTRVRDTRQRLFNRLLDDAADATILYVGFRRQDSDFAETLLEVERAVGPLQELRRSYALQPGFIAVEARRWEQRKVTLIDMKAADFFARVEDALPANERYISSHTGTVAEAQPIALKTANLSPEVAFTIEQNYEVVDGRMLRQNQNLEEFFSGAPPTWGTISAGVDAKRDITDDILNMVLEDPLLDRKAVQFVLIHAEAGTGKSTLLRRLGFELALTWDRTVVALKPYGSLEFLDLERLVDAVAERVYILIDDATTVARELAEFLRLARQTKAKITVIATARTNEWREAQEGYSIAVTDERELSRLSRDEIERVISTLAAHESLGLLAGASRETQIAAFESRADKQLLVALREATEGKAFDEIVVDEYDRVPSPDGQRAYLLVAALHRLGILTRAGLLHRALGIPLAELGHRVFTPTTKVIVSRDIVGEAEHYYSTRHQLIADIVFDRKIGSERRRLEYYEDLVKYLDLGYGSDADAYRKLTRGGNQHLLKDFREASSKREIMRELIKVNPGDAFAYQHAAMMEMEEGNLEVASKYLNEAVRIRPGDASIRDTEGRLALLSAKSETDLHLADAKYAKAEDLFQRNIQRRRDEPFGYRHLAQTYIDWSTIQENQDKRLHYVSLAYETLLNGISTCSSSSMLHQFLGELEESFGKPDEARRAFEHALLEKPSDVITRFLAARLEERESNPKKALQILKEGLGSNPRNPELHYRIAVLMATVEPTDEVAIRGHFQAATLGPMRNYMSRIAYGAYLFSRGDFVKSQDQFAQLEDLVVTSKERFEPHRFAFGSLAERHQGRIKHLGYDFAFVEYLRGASDLYASLRHVARDFVLRLFPGAMITYEIQFNMKGPIATRIVLA